jgi:hypothetical protein
MRTSDRGKIAVKTSLVLAGVVLVATVTGCSSSSGNASRQSSAPTENAGTAGSGATAENAATTAAVAPLEVYPGATKLPTQMRGTFAFCGTKMTTVVYRVKDASAQTVAAWYASHIPGGIRAPIPNSPSSNTIEIFQPGGRAAATITQMHFDPRLAAAAKGLGADQTTLGLVSFDPPLPDDWIDMVRAAAGGDAAAKARVKAKCGEAAP